MGEPWREDLQRRLRRHWGWVVGYGVVTLVLGIFVLAWPGATLLVIAVLFGCQLIVYGGFRFVSAFAYHSLTGGTRVLLALLGVLALILGLWAIRHIDLTLLVLAGLLGIFWIVDGAVGIYTAMSIAQGTPGRGWAIASGILAIIAGIIVLAYPAPTLVVLTVILGVWLLVFGVMEIVSGFHLRSVTQQPAHQVDAAR